MKGRKQSRFSRVWRTILCFLGILVIACAIFFIVRGHKAQTHVTLHASNPTQATFTDDNFVDFTGNSGVPDVNNNRTLNDTEPLNISYGWESGPYAPAFKMDLTNAEIAQNPPRRLQSRFVHGKGCRNRCP